MRNNLKNTQNETETVAFTAFTHRLQSQCYATGRSQTLVMMHDDDTFQNSQFPVHYRAAAECRHILQEGEDERMMDTAQLLPFFLLRCIFIVRTWTYLLLHPFYPWVEKPYKTARRLLHGTETPCFITQGAPPSRANGRRRSVMPWIIGFICMTRRCTYLFYVVHSCSIRTHFVLVMQNSLEMTMKKNILVVPRSWLI